MSSETRQNNEYNQPVVYQIRIKGHLDDRWADWFGGLAITLEENGDMLLTAPVPDQAALFGLLRKVRDLGMQLISVNRVDTPKPLELLKSQRTEKEKIQ
jgi:hypothetical protein